MRVVGLTGGIATGKSTVGRILRDTFEVPVVDADQASRNILEPGKAAYSQVLKHFGHSICAADGRVDRAKLRDLISRDPEAKSALEAITHPAIRTDIAESLLELSHAGHVVAVVEAALLVETGSWKHYRGLVVVSCDRETQIRRVMARDQQTAEQAIRLISTQFSMEEKEAVATVVIRNNGTLKELVQATTVAWKKLMCSE